MFLIIWFILMFYIYIYLKNKEIERVMDLLKDESSDILTVLEDLNEVFDRSLILNI